MDSIVTILASLGDKTRYSLLILLLEHDYCVGALARKLEISESSVSQHLKILRDAGVIRGEKRGYYTHYAVNKEVLERIADHVRVLAKSEKQKTMCVHNWKKDHMCETCVQKKSEGTIAYHRSKES